MMDRLWIIGLTHKTTDLEEIGKFHLEDTEWGSRLGDLKTKLEIDELCYLSTCNRVEFLIVTPEIIDSDYLEKFASILHPEWDEEAVLENSRLLETLQGERAVRHLLSVASSVDSMVIGEREIITQVRQAYERCLELGLTGDILRTLFRKTVETAKAVYTETEIARRPVSVVSLAYRRLQELDVPLDARVVVIGTGQTNKTMTRFLKKHGYTNFTLFNRTISNGTQMAEELDAELYSLDELANYNKGFDVLLTCTASADTMVNADIYSALLQRETNRKVVIDLAVPGDFDVSIVDDYKVQLISMIELQKAAKENLNARENELERCKEIIEHNLADYKKVFKRRQVELAMNGIPKTVHEIRRTACEEVFAKDLNQLDDHSKEVIDKMMDYLEKKYISVPMKMAKEILLEKEDLK